MCCLILICLQKNYTHCKRLHRAQICQHLHQEFCYFAIVIVYKCNITDYFYIKNNHIPICLDQPFIVYNAIFQNKYDNQIMKSYVENNPFGVSPKIIVIIFQAVPVHMIPNYLK